MFLFTTPDPVQARPPAQVPVVDAIRNGAQTTGADFDYLLRTAKRESALDPAAKAGTSSATGLFQFVEQTWLGLVKSEGDRAGLGEQSKAVSTRPDGTYTVADPSARQAILKLREDPQVASVMAGALTQQNRETLTGALGRPPSGGELYIAHVLGARGAADLIGKAQASPTTSAAALMPDAARANRSIFYDRTGRARGVSEVYAVLSGMQTGASGPAGTPAAAGSTATGTDPAAATPTGYKAPGLEGLFQTGPRTGPVSDAVARLWRSQPTQPAVTATSFFPRAGTAAADGRPVASAAPAGVGAGERASISVAAETGAAIPAAVTLAQIPLPPPRPSAFAIPAVRLGGMRPSRASVTAQGSTP